MQTLECPKLLDYNPPEPAENFTKDELWSNAQAFTIQFTKFCQTCGYTAPEVVRLFGSKAPVTSYSEAAFECAQVIVNAKNNHVRKLNGDYYA
jgi:hypothetical protein